MSRGTARALTEAGIERLAKAQKGKRLEYFDRLAPGLVLRVTDRGVKSWSVYYRLAGKQTRLTLGTWPAVGVADARQQARDIRDQASAGVDPKRARRAVRARSKANAERTFRHFAELYIRRECPKLARGHERESFIRSCLMPAWAEVPISELRRRDAIRIFDALIDEGRPWAAYHCFEIIKRMFNWLVERDELEASPFAAMRPPIAKTSRDRALDDEEIRTLWSAFGQMGYPFGPCLKLLLLTGQRRSEAAEMSWSEIDMVHAEWTIPAKRSKSRRQHSVPISSVAAELIAELPDFAGPYVFTTTGGARPISGWSKAKARVDELSGVRGWRIHDLRRTVRTELARLGVPEIVGERVLNHAPRGLSAVYNVHEYGDEKRQALERWAAKINSLLDSDDAKVVAMR